MKECWAKTMVAVNYGDQVDLWLKASRGLFGLAQVLQVCGLSLPI